MTTFVVVAFVRGRWAWLRVISDLEIERVSTPATTVTLEMGDRQGATIFKDFDEAQAHARIVKGRVTRGDWKPGALPAKMVPT